MTGLCRVLFSQIDNIGTEEPHYYLTNDTVKVVVNSEVTILPVSWFEFANGLSLQLGQ